MTTKYFKHGVSTIPIIILLVLFFSNIECQSQKINNDSKPVASINFNLLENLVNEQLLRQQKSEKIVKNFNLNLEEKELFNEIKQLATEAKQSLKDADKVAEEIVVLNKTIVNSTVLTPDEVKAERKIRRQENYELSLRYDAEELFEIGNNLLFQIYSDHFPTSGVLISKGKENQEQIKDLMDLAQELFEKAKKQDKASDELNYKSGIDFLKKANFLKREAIKKYEQAYSLYYNIPINKDEYSILTADVNMDIPDKDGIYSGHVIIYSDQLKETNVSESKKVADSLIFYSDKLNYVSTSDIESTSDNINNNEKLNKISVLSSEFDVSNKQELLAENKIVTNDKQEKTNVLTSETNNTVSDKQEVKSEKVIVPVEDKQEKSTVISEEVNNNVSEKQEVKTDKVIVPIDDKQEKSNALTAELNKNTSEKKEVKSEKVTVPVNKSNKVISSGIKYTADSVIIYNDNKNGRSGVKYAADSVVVYCNKLNKAGGVKYTADSVIIYSDKANKTLNINKPVEVKKEPKKSNDIILYRVQIGAFTKTINVKEFHGLYPLVEDKKDQKEFAKYMVGEYFSYKAASEARRIMINTTKYQDAFVVAYKNNVRVPIVNDQIESFD